MGAILTPQKQYRKGTVNVALLEFNKVVTFMSPMPDMNYDLYFNVNGLNVGVNAINKTTEGFTMTLGVSIAGTITWLAIQQLT